jgi:hypothetical protein
MGCIKKNETVSKDDTCRVSNLSALKLRLKQADTSVEIITDFFARLASFKLKLKILT